jgi:hypothetical protein
VITAFLVSCGCISGTRDIGITARPTIDDTKWEPVVDHTCVLTATAGDPDRTIIPVVPNTAYRLKTEGQKPMELSLNPDEGDLENATDDEGASDAKYRMFASAIYGFDGRIRRIG